MSSTYHTVSDEMAWTDWSQDDRTRQTPARESKFKAGRIVALFVAAAALAGVIYLVPPGSY